MKQLCVLLTLACLLSMPAHALSVVTADYDSDRWEVERLFTEQVDGIPHGWIPLRKAAEHLPIEVSWDEAKREVVVFSHALPWGNPYLRTFRYKADNMPLEFIIKDGVTYCHPRMMAFYLWNMGFEHDGELYCIAQDSPDSKLIDSGESAIFERKVLTALLEIKLKLPEDYAFIRKHLTGGIQYVAVAPERHANTAAWIRPADKRPVCNIVGDGQTRHNLAGTIAHEAHHVWEYYHGGIDEAAAHAYGDKVKAGLQRIN